MLRRMRRKKFIIVKKTYNDIYSFAIATGADFSALLLPFLPPFPLSFGGLLELLFIFFKFQINHKTI